MTLARSRKSSPAVHIERSPEGGAGGVCVGSVVCEAYRAAMENMVRRRRVGIWRGRRVNGDEDLLGGASDVADAGDDALGESGPAFLHPCETKKGKRRWTTQLVSENLKELLLVNDRERRVDVGEV
jgi:hypothetical protein